MTNLEQALANILNSIEKAKIAGNSLALAGLMQRKDVICAALAAPEQCWHDPRAQVSSHVPRHHQNGEKVLMPMLGA
jgi:hypothetical protein